MGVDEREMIRQDCRLEHELGRRIGELERELAEARKDAERLDWLELMQLEEDVRRVILWPAYSQGHSIHVLLRGESKSFLGLNLREAIDKAHSTTPTKGADTQST